MLDEITCFLFDWALFMISLCFAIGTTLLFVAVIVFGVGTINHLSGEKPADSSVQVTAEANP